MEVGGARIPWSDKIKYLGAHLDTKLTFAYHVKDTEKTFSTAIKLFYPLINRKSELNRENKLILVKVIIQAILLYACMGFMRKNTFKETSSLSK